MSTASKSIGIALLVLAALLLTPGYPVAAILFSQPPDPAGGLYQSSWWSPSESNFDKYLWDNFTLTTTQDITGIQWRGGYDPNVFNGAGTVVDFEVAIYASNGAEPAYLSGPLVTYPTGGNAGQIFAGTVGIVDMYDYSFTLPAAFQAQGATKYWVYIVAEQTGNPDWGLSKATGGDTQHFRLTHDGSIPEFRSGDLAFTLQGPPVPISGLSATNDSPTVLGQATTFTATVSSGNDVSYNWTFGDQTSGSGAVVTHTYAAAGNYTAVVTASNALGTVTAPTSVTVNPIPIPVETFTVMVSDTSAVAIAGADVTVDHPGTAPQTTDAAGQATFTLPAGGTYLYTIEAAGYVRQEVSSGNTIVDVTLVEIDATISGIVEDTNGTPLVGATVTAFQPVEVAVTYRAVSGAGGAYTIDLPTGAPNSGYTVVAELAGFVSVEQTDQAAGIVDFTGSKGLQAKTTITSVTATVAGTGVKLDITAEPAFTAVSEADVTVTSTGGTGLLGPLSLAGGTIAVTYSALEDFTVLIKADTSEDHDPNVGYFASSPFSYVADDPAADSARMDVDAGGGTLNLTANGQTATVVVPVGGISRPATVVIKQLPKTVETSDTEGSPTYVYEVTAVDSDTGTPLTADEINRIELTLPIDLDIVQPGDLEDDAYVIYQAADTATLEAGGGTPVPASQIISTDYVGGGILGSVRFWVDHLSAFGAGATAAVTPPPDGGGGGGGGGCFISTSYGSIPPW